MSVTRRELIRFQDACQADGRRGALTLGAEAQRRLLYRHGDFDRLAAKLDEMSARKRAGLSPLPTRERAA